MNLTETIIAGGCMRLEVFQSTETRKAVGRDRKTGSTSLPWKTSLPRQRRFTKRQITELFFENCIGQLFTKKKCKSHLAKRKHRVLNTRFECIFKRWCLLQFVSVILSAIKTKQLFSNFLEREEKYKVYKCN